MRISILIVLSHLYGNKDYGKPERLSLAVQRAAKPLHLTDYWKILERDRELTENFDKAIDAAATRNRKVRRRIIFWGIILGFIALIVFLSILGAYPELDYID